MSYLAVICDSKCQKENTKNKKHKGDVQIIMTWDFSSYDAYFQLKRYFKSRSVLSYNAHILYATTSMNM